MGKSYILIPPYSGNHKRKHHSNLNCAAPAVGRNEAWQRKLHKTEVITVQEMKEQKMRCDLLAQILTWEIIQLKCMLTLMHLSHVSKLPCRYIYMNVRGCVFNFAILEGKYFFLKISSLIRGNHELQLTWITNIFNSSTVLNLFYFILILYLQKSNKNSTYGIPLYTLFLFQIFISHLDTA